MPIVVVAFHLPIGAPKGVYRDFHRAVYGEETSSWGGRYGYRRHGLLDDIPHVRVYWGLVLLRARDLPLLRKLLEAYSAEYFVREIKPLKEDLVGLGVKLQ